ncbi:TPA: hypothetical protein DDW35_03525 [Candidatus Sumerlaeota bacterium]|jgi:hypothetical protein|nr:hypothetical protein [Candidatus Sumerlaeota bacterium]
MTAPTNTTLANPFSRFLRKLLPLRFFAPFFDAPVSPMQLPAFGNPPDGLRLLHCADSVPEAELLTQVLTEAGIHVEFVPTWTGGAFGMSGSNNDIYVQEDDFSKAKELVKEYFDGNPVEEDLAENQTRRGENQ